MDDVIRHGQKMPFSTARGRRQLGSLDVEIPDQHIGMHFQHLDVAEPDLALSVPERETPDSRLARSLSSSRLSNLSSPTLRYLYTWSGRATSRCQKAITICLSDISTSPDQT